MNKSATRGYTANRSYRIKRQRLRDQFLPCWICGEEIDYEASEAKGEPRSFTADHVDPISLGGSVTGELRPAHYSCNAKRGNRDNRDTWGHARSW